MEEQVSTKDEALSILSVEKQEMEKTCEKLSMHMKNLEQANTKLRGELEEVNVSFRKLMRA